MVAVAPLSNAPAGPLHRLSDPPRWVEVRAFDPPKEDAGLCDVAFAPDGSLWATEEEANSLLRLEPNSAVFSHYPLKAVNSAPSALVVDGLGHVWFAASPKRYIGQLDPALGSVDVFDLSGWRPSQLEGLALSSDGTLWFVASPNLVGALDTTTGDSRVMALPTAEALPTQVVVGEEDVPYACEFGTNKIARITPSSLSIREYELPEGARPRGLALASDGFVFYSDYARGKLGRVDTKRGAVREWSSPSGEESQPSALTSTPDGRIWYVESGIAPNMLVRFDPDEGRFQVAPVDCRGTVHNIVAIPDGRVVFACSGNNRVFVASPL
jgi:virginiamycin B lyase